MSASLSILRVAIIGAGVSGVATAAALLKLGCKHVTIYDRHLSLSALHRAHSTATVVQANGTRVLDALDVLNALSASASLIHRISQRNSRGRLRWSFSPTTALHSPTRTKDGRAITSLVAPYTALHSALTSHLPVDTIRWNSDVEAVERDQSGYRLSFASSSPSAVRADLIVAADGADSSIRDHVVLSGEGSMAYPHALGGVLVEGVSKGEMWEEQRSDELLEVLGNGQRVGAARLPDGAVYWYATVNDSHAASTSSPRSFAAALSSLPSWVSNMVAATPMESYTAGPLRHLPPSATLYRDGVVVVGSSSVLLPPDLQQQTAASLESALTLALSLHSSSSLAGGLQRYSSLTLPRLTSLYTAAMSESQQAIRGSTLMSSLRNMASSLMPTQVKDALLGAIIGYDTLHHFPNSRQLLVARKPKLFGQAGQLLADRLETDLGDWDEKWAADDELQRRQRGGRR